MAEVAGPRVRVVVVNWNSVWFTARCLRSLLATEWRDGRLELVVVDNGSVDGSLELLRHQFPQVTFVANSANFGFAEGCNRAMRDLDRVDYVALVNNDAVVDPGWLGPLVECLETDRGAGAAAAKLVLEPSFARVEVSATSGALEISRVEVGGIDVTTRTQFHRTRAVGDPFWPMDVTHHIDDTAELLVPVGAGRRTLELALRGDGRATVRSGATISVFESVDGEVSCELAVPDERVELLNGLGTDRGEDSEGFDRHFGEPADSLTLTDGAVPGFCGGGVLLRTEMLRQIGLFDPRFFAYYEDMDLSWRASRAGWRIVTVRDSVIRHAFGGSGGSANPAFFFLNYRNWLLTVIRNADSTTRRRAFKSAWDRIKWAIRSNILNPVRSGSRPKLRLTLAWGRVVAAAAVASPSLLIQRSLGRPPGLAQASVPSQWLQPKSVPSSPAPRPGGPLVVHLDVTDVLAAREQTATRLHTAGPTGDPRCGEDPIAELRDLDLLGFHESIQVLPVRRREGGGGLRRITASEMSTLLGETDHANRAEMIERGEEPPDVGAAVLRVRLDSPGTVLLQMEPGGRLRVAGDEEDLPVGPDLGVEQALIARFGTP